MKGQRILREYERDVEALIRKYHRSIKLVGVYSVFYDPKENRYLVDTLNLEGWDETATRVLIDQLIKCAIEKGWIKEVVR